MNYIYVSDRKWAIDAFLKSRTSLSGNWYLATTPNDLEALLGFVNAKYVFFPHWSHIVPEKIVNKFDCVCFHMTDLPYGRGGSPLQNLIARGISETKLTALKMEKELDAGPIYKKDPLNLSGTAEEILVKMSNLAINQIKYIIENSPEPVPQNRRISEVFKRRQPSESQLVNLNSLDNVYDHIRMLDAPGYPHAYLEDCNFKYEFSNAKKSTEADYITANVKIMLSGAKDNVS